MDLREAIPLLGHWQAQHREEAAEALVAAGADAVPSLVAALEHPSAAVRGQAALCLGRIGDRRALLPLLEASARLAPGDDRTYCVRAAVDLVGDDLRDDRHLGDFFAALLRDADYFVRALACRALGLLAHPRAAMLLRRAEKDRESWVRESATSALAEIGRRERSRDAAEGAATTTVAPSSPAHATETPASAADDGAPASPAIELADDATDDESTPPAREFDDASEEAPYALAPPTVDLDAAAERLFADEPTTRALAAHDLEAAGAPAGPAIVAALGKGGRRADPEALSLLGRLRAPEGLPLCTELAFAGARGNELRAVALRALGRIATGKETGLLDALLATPGPLSPSGDPYVRAAAAAALGAFRSIRALRALVGLLGDHHELVREDAAAAIGRAATSGLPDLCDALCDALRKERDLGVREALHDALREALAIGAIDEEAASRGATQLVDETRPDLRRAALLLAASTGRPNAETVKIAIEGLQSDDVSLARAACELASRLVPTGFGPATELLTRLASASDRALSRAAIVALGEVGGASAAATLRQLRADADPGVAEAARDGLARLPAFDVEIKPLRWDR